LATANRISRAVSPKNVASRREYPTPPFPARSTTRATAETQSTPTLVAEATSVTATTPRANGARGYENVRAFDSASSSSSSPRASSSSRRIRPVFSSCPAFVPAPPVPTRRRLADDGSLQPPAERRWSASSSP
jgi:hypothetical protein